MLATIARKKPKTNAKREVEDQLKDLPTKLGQLQRNYASIIHTYLTGGITTSRVYLLKKFMTCTTEQSRFTLAADYPPSRYTLRSQIDLFSTVRNESIYIVCQTINLTKNENASLFPCRE